MASNKKSLIDYNKWCIQIFKIGYIASALTILAHVIWYFADRNTMKVSPELYPFSYIIIPAICLFVLNILVDTIVHSNRFSLLIKECFSLMLFIVIPLYLSMTHNNVIVLLCLYVFPIVASSIFSNTRLTSYAFMTSLVGILVTCGKAYIEGKLSREMIMGVVVICFALLGIYLLARELIRFGQNNLNMMKKVNEEAIKNELAFYQAQIQPHFLCNAINTIVSLCYTDGEKAAVLLANLTEYLRFTFDFNSQLMMISLEKEIQLVKVYVEIEKARFGEQITVEYNIEPELLNIEIPSFCLQPLVENAIKHGLRKKETGGTVTITAKKDNNVLILSVSDTGVGMSNEKRDKLINSEDSGEGIGVYNVKRRVMGWKDAQFDIQSTEGEGTTITMRISDVVT